MLNVNDKYSCVPYRDELKGRLNCASFERLLMVNDVIKSCRHSSVKKIIKTLTSPSGEAFVVTTEINMSAAQYLLTEHKFDYVLPAVTSADLAEKFFGQTRQQYGGSFYIDTVNVMAVAKTQVLHQLLKLKMLPTSAQAVLER